MTPAFAISTLALSLGAIYGLACLVSPEFAARSVRLQADPERPGGYSEFRATFGGVFLGLHLAALAFILMPQKGGAVAAGVLAAGWIGAAIGRLAALFLDAEKVRNTSVNWKLVPFEMIMALAIAAPLLQGLLSN